MTEIIVTTRAGEIRRIRGHVGRSLMEVIRDSGIDEIEAICGGTCTCSTCHIYVAEKDLERLPAMSDEEREMLSASAPRAGSRLACQVPLTDSLDGLHLTIAP
jgi:2Fe-2S ferredoxin